MGGKYKKRMVFISFGKTRREIESTEDGGIVIKKYLIIL